MKISYKFFYFLPVFVLFMVPLILVFIDPLPRVGLGSFWRGFGLLLILLGGAIFIAAHRVIYRPEQWKGALSALPGEPDQLVTRGPYRFVRHPIVLGIALILIGEGLLAQSIMPVLWLIVMAAIGIPILIYVEEPRLEEKFGQAYRKYKGEVPRFIPKIKKNL